MAKLLPSNIQCQVPANSSAVLACAEPACRLVACANTSPAPNVMLVAKASPITAVRDSDRLFSVSVMILVSRFSFSKMPSRTAFSRNRACLFPALKLHRNPARSAGQRKPLASGYRSIGRRASSIAARSVACNNFLIENHLNRFHCGLRSTVYSTTTVNDSSKSWRCGGGPPPGGMCMSRRQ